MDSTHYVLAGNLISGNGEKTQRKVVLTIHGNCISKIQQFDNSNHIDKEKIIDLSHCTLLPPLFDCSITLSNSPSINLELRDSINHQQSSPNVTLFHKHLNYCFAHGVLGVANNNTPPVLNQQDLKDSMAREGVLIKTSPPLQKSATANDCEVRDFLRIEYSSGPASDGHSLMTEEELCRQIENNAHLQTVVVANGSQHVMEAINAGCHAIEQGYEMGRENLRRIADLGILWIPNVLLSKTALDGSTGGGEVCCRFSQRYVAPGKPIPGAEQFWKKVVADHLSQLRYAREINVRTAVGTGAGNMAILHGESVVEEMKLFLKAGYTLEETVFCASASGAEFFSQGELGAIKVGGPATFLFTRGTPQQLPRKLAFLEGMYINGSPCS